MKPNFSEKCIGTSKKFWFRKRFFSFKKVRASNSMRLISFKKWKISIQIAYKLNKKYFVSHAEAIIPGTLSLLIVTTMKRVRHTDIHGNISSANLCECGGIQNEQEIPLLRIRVTHRGEHKS